MVPERISQWWIYLVEAARANSLDVYLLAAVMDHESNGGEALQPKGPAGTGDWTPRYSMRYAARLDCKEIRDSQGRITYMPGDGLGFGRGLMQIDFGFHQDFCHLKKEDGSFAWQDPAANIAQGAAILAASIIEMGTEDLGVCAYNAGPASVRKALAAGQTAESATEGGSYLTDVLRRKAEFLT